ncbi:MAG: hypothetical protein K0V04_41665 [Deltaproteobacteria bacterium]|nr:hypothetical protein [Deltaproteobacteria bacterium]
MAAAIVTSIATAPVQAEPDAPSRHTPHVQLGPVGAAYSLGDWRGAPSFRWGASVGYRFRPGRSFGLIAGLDLSHDVVGDLYKSAGIEGPGFNRSGHEIGLIPTVRLGGGKRAFTYGLLGVGMAVHDTVVHDDGDRIGRERDVGLGVQLGAGFQILLPARLAIGAEVSLALHRYRADGDFAGRYLTGFDQIAEYIFAPQIRGGVVLSWGW